MNGSLESDTSVPSLLSKYFYVSLGKSEKKILHKKMFYNEYRKFQKFHTSFILAFMINYASNGIFYWICEHVNICCMAFYFLQTETVFSEGMRDGQETQKANKTYLSQESHNVTWFTGSVPKVTKVVNDYWEGEPHQRGWLQTGQGTRGMSVCWVVNPAGWFCSSCLWVTHAHVCVPVHPLTPQEDLGRIVSLVCDQYPTWGKKT